MSSREQMLTGVRNALGERGPREGCAWTPEAQTDPDAQYIRGRRLPPRQLARLFEKRCGEYKATVTCCGPDAAAISSAVSEACARHEPASLVIPPGLADEWLPADLEAVSDDPPLALPELSGFAGALTGCAVAIALTGTIVLDGGVGQGRRAVTLVPDLLICIVRTTQLVYNVPEALSAVAPTVKRFRRPVTLISGPSATSDIELKRVDGVHGPRRLEIVLAGPLAVSHPGSNP